MLNKEISVETFLGLVAVLCLIFILFVLPGMQIPPEEKIELPPAGVVYQDVTKKNIVDPEIFVLPCDSYEHCLAILESIFQERHISSLKLKCSTMQNGGDVCCIKYQVTYDLISQYAKKYCYSDLPEDEEVCDGIIYLVENSRLI